MLTDIKHALAATVAGPRHDDISDGTPRHFANEECAFKFLEEHSAVHLFSKRLLPLHKWLQAIYLTDGGDISVRPDRLGGILDIPPTTACAVLEVLGTFRRK